MNTLPKESIRITTARVVLWGYVILNIIGIVLHAFIAWYKNLPINWLYQVAMFCLGGTALLSLYWLRYSLSQAIQLAIWMQLASVGVMAVYDLATSPETDIFGVFLLHVGVLILGLVLGFEAAMRYATATTLFFMLIGIFFTRFGKVFPLIVLAYGIALPSKLVERLIEESITELTTINQKLKAEIAERKRTEKALHESEYRYRALTENSGVGVWQLTPDGYTIYANPAMCSILEIDKPEELAGKTHHSFLTPASLETTKRERAKRPQGSASTYEIEIVGKKGGRCSVIVNGVPLFGSDGKLYSLLGTFTDITARKRAEEALQQRTYELALLNRASQAFNSTLDLEQVLVTVLGGVRQLLDVIGASVWLVDQETGELVCQQSSGLGSEIVRGWRLVPGAGFVGWTAAHGESVIVPDTQADERHFKGVDQQIGLELRSILSVPLRVKRDVIGVLQVVDTEVGRFGTANLALLELLAASAAIAIENAQLYDQARQEIAQRQRAEEALRESEERYRAVFEQATDSIVLIDAETEALVEFNDMAHENLGYTREEFQKLKISDFEVSESAEEVTKHMEKIIKEGTDTFETKHRTKGGEIRDILVSSRTIPIRERRFFLSVWRDVTERKRLAEQAAEAEVLRELDRLRSELIDNLSHELRTPIGLIKIFGTTLLREDVVFDRETRREFLHDIETEVDRLEQIVDNLLDLSQLRSGRLRMDKRPTDISQLIGAVMAEMEITLSQHRFVRDFPAEPLVATVDAKLIERTLLNLLNNAVKYSPESGDITVQGCKDAGGIIIKISDQGIGIPSADLERIFERFYRVDNDVTRSVRGAGLGLALCQGVVEAHGGRIWAESTLGVGSTFSFTLPTGDETE